MAVSQTGTKLQSTKSSTKLVEAIRNDALARKITPTCSLCGKKHWPLDPSCIGKKGARAEAKAKAKAEAEKRAEIEAEPEEKFNFYEEQIAKVKADAAKMIAGHQAKLEAEAARIIARVKADAVDAVAKVREEFEEKIKLYAKVKTAETVSDRYENTVEEKHPWPTMCNELPANCIGKLLAIRTRDIMQKNIVWGSPDDSVQQAIAKMQQHDAESMMVGQNGVLEGIVSKSDLMGAVSPYLQPFLAKWQQSSENATLQIKVKWIMIRPVHTISPDTLFAATMKDMRQFGWRVLPVVDQHNKVQGLVTPFNILKIRALLKLESNPNILSVVATGGKTYDSSCKNLCNPTP